MRRKAKSRKVALEWFKIKVTASAASVSYRGPGLSRIDPDGDANSVIKIEGTLDRPVLKWAAELATQLKDTRRAKRTNI